MRWLRLIVVLLLLKPLIFIMTGLSVRGRHRLPQGDRPAILIANHNSHLDALLLVALLPWRAALRVRPVVAGDYFATSWWGRWLVLGLLGGIPIARSRREGEDDPLAPARVALDQGAVLVFFPEGTRGEPEVFGPLRKGLGHLVASRPETLVVPVWLVNLGRAWPRGVAVPVPLACVGRVGRPVRFAVIEREAARTDPAADDLSARVERYMALVERHLRRLEKLVRASLPRPYDFGDNPETQRSDS